MQFPVQTKKGGLDKVPPEAGTSISYETVKAAAVLPDAAALPLLARYARAHDPYARRMAVEVIGKHPQGRQLTPLILQALNDPSEYVVRTACEVAAHWVLTEARDAIVPLLSAASSSTRLAALRCIGSIWLETDFPQIFSMYEQDPEDSVRKEAAWVLRRHVSPENMRLLFESFSKDAIPRHRQWACEIASSSSDETAMQILSALSADPDGHVRHAANLALERKRPKDVS
jgi:hypothetical protein